MRHKLRKKLRAHSLEEIKYFVLCDLSFLAKLYPCLYFPNATFSILQWFFYLDGFLKQKGQLSFLRTEIAASGQSDIRCCNHYFVMLISSATLSAGKFKFVLVENNYNWMEGVLRSLNILNWLLV